MANSNLRPEAKCFFWKNLFIEKSLNLIYSGKKIYLIGVLEDNKNIVIWGNGQIENQFSILKYFFMKKWIKSKLIKTFGI